MTTPIVRRALEVPGRLVWGATNLATAYPHGGTELGFVGRISVVRDAPVQEITAEEWGNEPVEVVSGGERWALTATLRDADDTAISTLFLNSATGATTGRRIIAGGATNRAGYLYSARAGILVFTPEAVISGNDDVHQMVVFYKAVPHVEAQADLAFRLGTKLEIPVAFIALRDSSSRLVKVGFRADLTLS